MINKELIIIGGGPAGLAAAIEAENSGISDILVLEREDDLGGILKQCIHNGFGLQYFGEELTGPEYAARFIKKALEMGIECKTGTMVLEITSDKVVTAINPKDGLVQYKAGSVILAMGCRERSRGAILIPGSRPAGIFTAGTAQRFVNIDGYLPGKKVVILGSGDIGLIMARRMMLEGAQVELVCEMLPYPGGLARNIVQCLDDFNIPLLLSHTVTRIHGRERVEGVTIAQVGQDRKPLPETERFVECDTLLLSTGLIPENELSKTAGVEIDPVTSGPVVDESMQTSVEGVFACGNVLHVHDLVDNVTLEAIHAGRSAAIYLQRSRDAANRFIVTKAGNGVRYIVPQKISRSMVEKSIRLFFRSDAIYRDAKITVEHNGRSILTKRKVKIAPGEMESINIEGTILEGLEETGEITVRIDKT